MSVTHLSSLPYCECGRKKRVRIDVPLCETCVAINDYKEGKYFVKRSKPELTYTSGGPRQISKSIGYRSKQASDETLSKDGDILRLLALDRLQELQRLWVD